MSNSVNTTQPVIDIDKEKIASLIRKHAIEYYEGHPTITDVEFDCLVDQLKKIDPNNELLHTVGYGYKPTKNKIKHNIPMGSLEKIHELKESFRVLSLKLDGLSCELVYEHGNFVRAVTRGDGIEGIIVTKNMPQNIERSFNIDADISIRGEIILTWNDAKKFSTKHPRNIASGALMSLSENPIVKKLKFIPFEVVINGKFLPPKERFEWLNKYWSYLKVPYVIRDTDDNITIEKRSIELVSSAKSLDIPYDGIVVENLDGTNKLAYKFEDVTYETTITDIKWNISNYGKMIPVAQVEPVDIDGTTISKCTLNNLKWITDNNIGIGSKVDIVKANQIIPKIVHVITPGTFKRPTVCPKCNTNLIVSGVHLVCPNETCPSKTINVLNSFFSHFALDGLGPKIIEKFNNYIIGDEDLSYSNMFPIYFKKLEQVKRHDGDKIFGSKTFEKIYDTIHNILTNRLSSVALLTSLNLPNINVLTITKISFKMDLLKNVILTDNWNSIINGGNNYKYVKQVFSDPNYQKMIKDVFTYFGDRVSDDEGLVNTQYNVAITGKVSLPRTKWTKLYGDVINVSDTVNKNTNYLVCNEPSTSSKYKKAQELNIPIISENKMISIINQARQTMEEI